MWFGGGPAVDEVGLPACLMSLITGQRCMLPSLAAVPQTLLCSHILKAPQPASPHQHLTHHDHLTRVLRPISWCSTSHALHPHQHLQEQAAHMPTAPPWPCPLPPQEIKTQFSADIEAVAAGKYDPWMEQPYNAMAAIILMDQFTRWGKAEG